MSPSRDPFSQLTSVPEDQRWVDDMLDGWRRWLEPGTRRARSAPCWRMGSTSASTAPRHDPAAAQLVEQVIGRRLPALHARVLRWYYLRVGSPFAACRELGVDKRQLVPLLHEARQYLGAALRPAVAPMRLQ